MIKIKRIVYRRCGAWNYKDADYCGVDSQGYYYSNCGNDNLGFRMCRRII